MPLPGFNKTTTKQRKVPGEQRSKMLRRAFEFRKKNTYKCSLQQRRPQTAKYPRWMTQNHSRSAMRTISSRLLGVRMKRPFDTNAKQRRGNVRRLLLSCSAPTRTRQKLLEELRSKMQIQDSGLKKMSTPACFRLQTRPQMRVRQPWRTRTHTQRKRRETASMPPVANTRILFTGKTRSTLAIETQRKRSGNGKCNNSSVNTTKPSKRCEMPVFEMQSRKK